MSNFICPVCGKLLNENEKTYICENRHSFDKSKSGYVNLLMSQQSADKRHGDDKLMVNSRRDFLDRGYYYPLAKEICNAVNECELNNAVIFDVGCGEGYYTKKISELCGSSELSGIDISKAALYAADKRGGNIKYAVASAFSLPFSSGSADIITNVFAPCAYNEFYRVLKNDGVLIKAVPLHEHLWELKEALYDAPYKNKPELRDDTLFELVNEKEISYKLELTDKNDIYALFTMTPYFYKTSKEDAEKLLSKQNMTVTAHFGVEVYRKRIENV